MASNDRTCSANYIVHEMAATGIKCLQLLIVIALCTGFSQAVVNVSVPLCFQDGVQWTVTGGTIGGITYVERTNNNSCVFDVTTTATQTFTVNYTLCSTTVSKTLLNTIHEFIIGVQEFRLYTSGSDTRWKIRCEFNTGTAPVSTTFIGVSPHPNGNPGNNLTTEIDPQPVLSLYINGTDGNETRVNTTSVLALGQNVTARITLNQNTTDYSMQVISGEMSSLITGSIDILSSVTLLNSSTYCALHPVFLSFLYLQDDNGVNYAETQFEVFLPSVPSINLQNTNIQLRIAFGVSLCLVGVGCNQQSCPDRTSRRRRQIDDGTTSGDNSTSGQNQTFNLSDGFQIVLDDSTPQSQIDPDEPTVLISYNPDETVCLDKTAFWGLIMGLIGFLVLACLASCLLCFYFLSCRRRKRKQVVETETRSSTTLSTLSTDRKLSGEPAVKQGFVLPRFVPFESSS